MFEKRTGDKVGAAHMLGVAAPGSATDVAPTWLVSEATQHSTQEYKRGVQMQTLKKGGGSVSQDSDGFRQRGPGRGGGDKGGAKGGGGKDRGRGGKDRGRGRGAQG